jgi:transcriptional regulator with XRE-family HTH domain
MERNLNIIYASRLYKLRRDANLKQPVVALALGKGQQAYSKLERGETDFSDEIVDGICNFFKINLDSFTQSDDKINCNNSPNSANTNSQINNAKIFEEVVPALIEELKAMREERKFYMLSIERLIKATENKKS